MEADPPDEASFEQGTVFGLLRVRAFRLYLSGHFVSQCGTAMQQVGLAWLIVELTGSGAALGGLMLANYLPALLVAPWGGVVADRLDKRTGVLATQALLGAAAIVLAVMTTADLVSLGSVYALAFFNGCVQVVDMPLRQVLVHELVTDRRLHRAIALTTAMGHATRTVGPAIAGVLIVAGGVPSVFMVNAFTFVAVIVSLLLIRPTDRQRSPSVPRAAGQVREGVRLVWRTPELRSTFTVLLLVGTFGFSFAVVLPLLARDTFNGDADTYGLLAAAMGFGSVAGALVTGVVRRPGPWRLPVTAILFGATAVLTASMPTLPLMVALIGFYGASHVFFVATCNVTVQLGVPAMIRGRVMALYGAVFWGSMAVGGPIVGTLCEEFGPRTGMVLSGLAVMLVGAGAAAPTRLLDRRLPRSSRRVAKRGDEASEIVELPAG